MDTDTEIGPPEGTVLPEATPINRNPSAPAPTQSPPPGNNGNGHDAPPPPPDDCPFMVETMYEHIVDIDALVAATVYLLRDLPREPDQLQRGLKRLGRLVERLHSATGAAVNFGEDAVERVRKLAPPSSTTGEGA